MSEVIENFIRKNPGLSEQAAFDGFVAEERIKSWVGGDETRRDRLRKEFGRTWSAIHAHDPTHTARSGPSGPSGPVMQQSRTIRVVSEPVSESAPAPAHAPSAAHVGGRKLQVLCAQCHRVEVWMSEDHVVQCRRCGRVYDDMLALVRVHPVGPLEFYFGEGWRGPATAVGILAALIGLYYLLRWV